MNLRERAQFALMDRRAEEVAYLEHVAECLVEDILEARTYHLEIGRIDQNKRTIDFTLEGIPFRAQYEQKTRKENGREIEEGEERKLWYLKPGLTGTPTLIPIKALADLGAALDSPLTGPESD